MPKVPKRRLYIALFHGEIVAKYTCTNPDGLNISKTKENTAVKLQMQALEAGVSLDLNHIIEEIEVHIVEDMRILHGAGDVYLHEHDTFIPVKVRQTVYTIKGHEDINYYRVYSDNTLVNIYKEWGCHLNNNYGDYLTITHPCE